VTERNPPIFLQTQAHPAEDVRRWLSGLVADTSGVIASGDLAVTPSTGMTVSVAGGRAYVPGSEATFQGSYFVENRGATVLTVTGGDATQPRRDLVVARVRDASYSGAVNSWALAIVNGTPAASPADPAAPANSLTLARLTVPAGASAIGSVTITDLRRRAVPAGVPVFSSSTDRAVAIPSPTTGMLSFLTSPGAGLLPRYEYHDGSAWVRLRPNITVSTASPSGGEDGDVWVKVV
jgi:hypothetical protein